MVIIIAAAVLILGIAFYQVVQGSFSALVMAVLTVLCAGASFALYEPLAELLHPYQPAHADAAALIATFIIPLLVLRVLADSFIPGNIVLGVWVDRIAGGTLGIITGMIVVGILMVALQMLPFGASVMTYEPFDDSLQRSSALVPFYCDEFVLGFMNVLSRGSLSSNRRLDQVHDDLLLESFCTRNTARKFGRTGAPPDALRSVAVRLAPVAKWRKDVPRNPLLDEDEVTKLLIVRCEIDTSARDEGDEQDPHQRWRLPGTHFRLVCESGRSYYPLAYLTFGKGGWAAHAAEGKEPPPQVARLLVVRPAAKDVKSLIVDWVYRIRQDDQPGYVTFRRVAKRAFTDQNDFTEKGGKMPPGFNALDREGQSEVGSKRSRRRS
jgi:hypothetical protein